MSYCIELPPEAALYYEIIIDDGAENFFFNKAVGYVRYRYADDVKDSYANEEYDDHGYMVIKPQIKSIINQGDSYWLMNFNALSFGLSAISFRHIRYMEPDEIIVIQSEYGSKNPFWTIEKENK